MCSVESGTGFAWRNLLTPSVLDGSSLTVWECVSELEHPPWKFGLTQWCTWIWTGSSQERDSAAWRRPGVLSPVAEEAGQGTPVDHSWWGPDRVFTLPSGFQVFYTEWASTTFIIMFFKFPLNCFPPKLGDYFRFIHSSQDEITENTILSSLTSVRRKMGKAQCIANNDLKQTWPKAPHLSQHTESVEIANTWHRCKQRVKEGLAAQTGTQVSSCRCKQARECRVSLSFTTDPGPTGKSVHCFLHFTSESPCWITKTLNWKSNVLNRVPNLLTKWLITQSVSCLFLTGERQRLPYLPS